MQNFMVSIKAFKTAIWVICFSDQRSVSKLPYVLDCEDFPTPHTLLKLTTPELLKSLSINAENNI